MTMQSWIQFWNRENKIHASTLHRDTHYAVMGADVLRLLPKNRPLTMLDWGCGEAHAAALWSNESVHVYLYDPTPRLEAYVRKRFSRTERVTVLSFGGIQRLPAGSVDVILIYSVFQYLTPKEAEEILREAHRLLSNRGFIILGDIVPRGGGFYADIADVLSVGWRYGTRLFADIVIGLIQTALSDYGVYRKRNGFLTYSEQDVIAVASLVGFRAERLPKNIGLSSRRMTFVLQK